MQWLSVLSGGNTVCHMPRRISAACSLFLQRLGTITCRVTGSRHYSEDLPQGGLELPCVYIFSGEPKIIGKVRKLLLSEDTLKSPQKKKQKVVNALGITSVCKFTDSLYNTIDEIMCGADRNIQNGTCKQQEGSVEHAIATCTDGKVPTYSRRKIRDGLILLVLKTCVSHHSHK